MMEEKRGRGILFYFLAERSYGRAFVCVCVRERERENTSLSPLL